MRALWFPSPTYFLNDRTRQCCNILNCTTTTPHPPKTLLDKQRRLSLSKALRYAHDIALGLNYLHTYSPVIIHRDLCPSNILLTPNGSAKVCRDFAILLVSCGLRDGIDVPVDYYQCYKPGLLGHFQIADFGFSKLTPPPPTDGLDLQSDQYMMTGGLGSLRYMAPEVLRHAQYNETVDVYSYAMVLYYMVAGAFGSQS